MSQFLDTYYSKASDAVFADFSINGGENDESNPDLEGNLDTQIRIGPYLPKSDNLPRCRAYQHFRLWRSGGQLF